MTQKHLDKMLEESFAEYEQRIYSIVAQVREENLIPYLQKSQRDFIAGYGVFAIREKGHEPHRGEDVCDANLPKRLLDILETNIPGMDNSVGSFMNSYPEIDEEIATRRRKKKYDTSRDWRY